MEQTLSLRRQPLIVMDKTTITFSIPAAMKFIAAAILGQVLGIPSLVWSLIGFMMIDYASGVGSAYINHELCSEEGFRGLIKKFMALLFVLAVHLAERQSGFTLHIGEIEVHMDQAAATLLIFNEIISIIENCASAGIPIPSLAVVWLQRFKKIYNIRRATVEEIQALRDEKDFRGPNEHQ